MAALMVILNLLLFAKVAASFKQSYFAVHQDLLHPGRVMNTLISGCEMQCAQICWNYKGCKSASFSKAQNLCHLSDEKVENLSQMTRKAPGYSLIQVIGDPFAGVSKDRPMSTCKAIQTARPMVPSGVYWVQPDQTRQTFPVYCDQETDGGGWTLVWSYRFTNYAIFQSPNNAVTPRPNWKLTSICTNSVPISTTVPLSEAQLGAMDFSLWKKIGREMLIKSNINNWISCQTLTGGLSAWHSGRISCRVVKRKTKVCQNGGPPVLLVLLPCGPALAKHQDQDVSGQHMTKTPPGPGPLKNIYYSFNGDTRQGWPIHDPCGTSMPHHLLGVRNPGGNVYVR